MSSETIASVLAGKRSEIWSIDPGATVYQAIQIMAEKGIGALLVMSGDNLAGIISERDYARKVILKDHSSKTTRVSEIMSAPVVTVTPDHTVEECMRVVTEKRIRHLPVVEGNRVVGVVTIGDLVKVIISRHEETINQLQAYISGSYPG